MEFPQISRATTLLKRELSEQRSLVGVAIKSAAELCSENQCTLE